MSELAELAAAVDDAVDAEAVARDFAHQFLDEACDAARAVFASERSPGWQVAVALVESKRRILHCKIDRGP
jgi:hypothetical protein